MNYVQRYLVEEHVEDYHEGHITRRELLRRATIILGSVTAATAALAACGVQERPSPAPAAATRTATPAASPIPTASPTAAGVAYATPPPAATTDGVTVRPDDPRITVAKADVKATDGATLIGYLARPKADGKYPGIIVVHENRGLTEHIKDVIRRVATAGMVGLGIDVVSRAGGADKLTDQAAYNAELGKRSVTDVVRDFLSAADHLKAQAFVDGNKLGATGFCYGGGVVWSLINSNAPLKAAVPFYGFAPQDVSAIGSTKTAVLGVYAQQDSGVTGSLPKMEEQLKRSGTTYQLTVYPGVGHAFHNDTGTRYNPEQARRAWVDAIEWFRRYLA